VNDEIIWDNVTLGVAERMVKSDVRGVNIKVFRHSLAARSRCNKWLA
jgi:hypothetical protein